MKNATTKYTAPQLAALRYFALLETRRRNHASGIPNKRTYPCDYPRKDVCEKLAEKGAITRDDHWRWYPTPIGYVVIAMHHT